MNAARTSPKTRAQADLIASLERICGPLGARRVVAESLTTARLRALPTEHDALLDFVRQHIVQLLHDSLGARDTADFLTHFLAAIEGLPVAAAAVSGLQRTGTLVAPSTTPRSVLLVCSDRLERLWLARMLAREEYEVVLVERFLDLAVLSEPPALALVDMSTANVAVLLAALATRRADVRVVAMGGNDAEDLLLAEEVLLRAGIYRFEVLGGEARGVELCTALEWQARD